MVKKKKMYKSRCSISCKGPITLKESQSICTQRDFTVQPRGQQSGRKTQDFDL